MASVWRHPESQYWVACFRDADGRQRRVSTRSTDRKAALHIAAEYEKATRTRRTLRQTRKAIERLHEEIAGEDASQKSLRQYALEWLGTKKPEMSHRAYLGYAGSVSQLLSYLGTRADVPIAELTKQELIAWRNHLAATLSTTTVNNHLDLVRMLFKNARRDGVCLDNPAEFIGLVRTGAKPKNRRPFTLIELQAVLAVANPEWRSLILFGLYTGQRISDLVALTWNNLDLERDEVRLVTGKTNRSMVIPMAPPLRAHIESLPAGEDAQAPLHPRAFAALSRTGSASILSSAFSDLLIQAGLRRKPASASHRSRGKGHSGRRRVNELSFHSLRRTATTLLHEAGVPPTVAQALIGHDSAEIHQGYIGIGREALRNAAHKFPSL